MAECFAGTPSYGTALALSSSKPATTAFQRSFSKGVRSLEALEFRRGGGESGVISGVGAMTVRRARDANNMVPPPGVVAAAVDEEADDDVMPFGSDAAIWAVEAPGPKGKWSRRLVIVSPRRGGVMGGVVEYE